MSEALLVDVRPLVVDVSALVELDHDGFTALVEVHSLTFAAGLNCEVIGARPLLRRLLDTALDDDHDNGPPKGVRRFGSARRRLERALPEVRVVP